MKKKFTFLIAALMLLTMISQSTRLWGQTKTDPSETFSYSAYSGQGTSGSGSACSTSSNGISIASTKAYCASDHVKEYSGSQLTFSSSVGNIQSIAITTSSNVNNVGLVSGQPGSISVSGSVATWTGDAASVKLYNKGSGQFRWTQIVVTYEASTTYTITCATGLANGSIASNVSEAAENDDVTITATPSLGYKLSTVTVTKVGGGTVSNTITGNTATFKMPADNVNVTASFVQCYTVTCATNLTHGSITADMATAAAGETVTITASPDDGYDLSAITVTNVDPDDIIIEGNTAMFEMPNSNVTVSATFTAKTTYEITKTVTPANSGTITAAANAWEGKTVNVSVSPAGGYIYSSIAITKTSDGTASGITPSGNATDGFTFTMPAYAVTITATFSTAVIYAKYSGDLTEGDYIISSSTNIALSNTHSSNRFSGTSITPSSNQIIDPEGSIVWHIAKNGDYWTIYNASSSKYATGTGSASQAGFVASPSDDKELWSITESSGVYTIKNKYNTSQNLTNNFFRWGGSYWACYASGTGSTLYKKVVTSTMAVASVANGTITATPAGGSAIAEDGSTTVSSGTTVTLSASGEGSYVLEAWDVYKTGDASTKVTVTSNTFTMPDYGVTVRASFRQPTTFTVEYSVNGSIVDGLTQSSIPEGNSVTLPTSGDVTTVPSGYAFAGWTENAATGELISGSTYTPTDNTTLYLVFIKSGETLGYNKVTSLENITEGTYIIVNDNYCLPSVSTGSSTAPAKSNDYKVTNASSTSTYTSVPANTEWIFTGSNTAMTITNSEGKYLYETNNNDGVRVHTTPDTWAFELNTSAPCYAMKGANNKRYCATYTSDWRSYTTKDYTNYNDGGRLYLYKKTPVYTLVKTISGSESMTNIEKTYIITVANGGVLTLSGTNNANAASLVIEDGGQLICNNAIQATVQKSITGYGEGNDKWYFIASPINVSDLAPTSVSNMLSNEYDLYQLNNTTWENYKEQEGNANPNFNLANGRGYLYANSTDVDLGFAGTTKPYDADYGISVAEGWNLIGNPYTFDAYANVAYYAMNESGTGITATTVATSTAVKPCTGIIVKADENGSVKFLNAAPSGSANNGNLQMVLAHNVATRDGASVNKTIDNAIVSFNEGTKLQKFYFGEPAANIFIPQNDEDYAIAFSNRQGDMPLNFKTTEAGMYTISFEGDNMDLKGVSLIDMLAEEKIDLSVDPSYTFIGSPADKAERFKIVFSPSTGSGADIFAYQSGSDIIVSGEGELQIFDVMGRRVKTQYVSGVQTVNVNAQGVYIMKLNEKTQKIIVR